MVYCIDHAEAAEEIVECITESLSNESTLITKKISRLYLVSDILNNCGVKVNKASNYRKVFQGKLLDIMTEVKKTYDKLESRIQAEGFRVRVLRVLKSWEDTGIYTSDFMVKLHNVFLGLEQVCYTTIYPVVTLLYTFVFRTQKYLKRKRTLMEILWIKRQMMMEFLLMVQHC